MIVAVNFANALFEKQRSYNTKSAYEVGKVDKVYEYSPISLDDNFRIENQNILSVTRGAGLWIWKPYIILKTLELLADNDYLFYSDAGVCYVNKVQYLVDCFSNYKQDIMPFELPFLGRQWTKRETFELLDYHDFSQNQIAATYILFRKSADSIAFVKEWLKNCCDERIISAKYFTAITEFSDFVEHREDQSVFDILCRKNRFTTFRDPSQFGDRPWQYAWVKNYSGKWNEWSLSIKKYPHAKYPRIVVSVRDGDPVKSCRKEVFKTVLNRTGIYSKWFFKWKNKAKLN